MILISLGVLIEANRFIKELELMKKGIEKQKSILIVALIGISCFLTYYFHAMLNVGTFFSHFFYVPIILSSIWWKRKGIAVALFLGLVFVLSHIIFRDVVEAYHDCFRAVIFVAIAVVVSFLSETITESEKKLKKNLELSRTFLNATTDGAALVDRQGIIHDLNESFAQRFHKRCEEMIGLCLWDFFSPKVTENRKKHVTKVFESGESASMEDERNGMWYYIKMYPVHDCFGQVIQVAIFAHDITERKQIEQALQESENKYRLLADNATDVIWTRDMNLDLTYVSPSIEKLTGYSVEEYMGLQNLEKMTPASMALIGQTFKEELKLEAQGHADPSLIRTLEIEKICKDGSPLWIEVTVKFIRNPTGQAVGILGISRDITNRKQGHELLRKSENKYRKIFENIQDVYFETSLDGTILEFSPSIESISHYTRKELIGKSVYDVYTHPEQREELLRLLLDKGKINDFEFSLTDKYGSQHLCTINAVLIKDEQDNPIKLIGSFRDISEKKQLEDQLRHAHKMEAIGILAGGIAHEFNNILAIIIPNTELAEDDVPDRSLARECLDEIRSAALRASEVVQQILSFARKSLTERKPVQITPIIKDCLRLLRASIPATIEISQEISCGFDTVLADPTQISQVIMNLCTNAAQAMNEHAGVLKVTLKNVDFENQDEKLDVKPGCYVALTVSDTGDGIKPEIIDRIFDPYFTTKEVGKGTGMGLAVIHGIVKNLDGTISVTSDPGKRSVFEVLLPVIEAETQQKAKEPEALPTGNEKILFIDDEKSIVKIVQRILERLGYQVETKTNPVEALELFRSGPDQFDLVITDMTMPKMTGENLAKEILNIRSDMPIILCTGFREKISEEKVRELGMSALVFKPFAPPKFALTVRKVLDEMKDSTQG